MDSFYRQWLLQNQKENQEAQQLLNQSNQLPVNANSTLPTATNLPTSSISSTTTTTDTSSALPTTTTSTLSTANTATAAISAIPSTSNQNVADSSNNSSVSDLFYENDKLQMFIEKADDIKQIKFRLQDHLFHMKIQLKQGVEPPLMRDILEFLQIGFNAFNYKNLSF